MSDLQELTNELMQDSEFKKAYEALYSEMDITRAILDARIRAGMTQIELAEKSGYSAERHLQVIQEESYEDGLKAGYEKGHGNAK